MWGLGGFVWGIVFMIVAKMAETGAYLSGPGDEIQLPLAVAYVAVFTVVGALIGYIRKPKPEDIV